MEPADPAHSAGRGLPLQYSGPAAASGRAGGILLREPSVIPESRARRVRPRVHRGPVHLPRRVAGGPADVAAALVAARPASAAVVEVLGGHCAPPPARTAAPRPAP